MADAEDQDAYELLGLDMAASEAEIRKAYRQRSLKVHPDRHPNNPEAAQKFHELNTAYELLLDPLKRSVLDAKLKAQQARKLRFAAYDNKRKAMMEELDKSEREFKKSRVDIERETEMRRQEEERIKEEGRKLMKAKQEAMLQRSQPRTEDSKGKERDDPPPVGPLDTTVRLKFSISEHPELTTTESIATALSRFGPLDAASIVLSVKPNKKNPAKSPKYATALVPFSKVDGAFAAVISSGSRDKALSGVDVAWAEGKEPAVVTWSKDHGEFGAGPSPMAASSSSAPQAAGTPFSTFPDDLDSRPPKPTLYDPLAAGLDFESLTFMRMRQAEREKLEREILEAEANE